MVRSLRNSSWLVLGLLVAATSAQAQWMWRDKGGRMHMSDLPPPAEVPEKDVLKRTAGARAPAATAPGASPAASAPASAPQPGTPTAAAAPRVDPELEARRRKQEQDQAAARRQAEEKVAAAKAENCDRAQKHMRTIDSGVRMSRLNDKGEREVMDDRLRAEEAERTRGVIAANCAQ
jgi:type IV secretory pathway VirB10-like protein